MVKEQAEKEPVEKERLQKVLAASGEYSRRQVERLIDEGKIKINGVTVRQKGVKVDPTVDKIQVGNKAFHYEEVGYTEVLIMNKPRRYVVTRSDPEGRPTIYDLLPKRYRTFKPVGRLDLNSQGLLFLTNDGDLILKLTHPRYHLEKVYEVKVSSHPDERQLMLMRRGVLVDGERTLPANIEVMTTNTSSTLLKFTLTQGKNRQIRKMCESVGLTVKELKRVAVGPFKLRGLRGGQFRLLEAKEMKLMKAITAEK